jgi:hypothetical protein
MVFVVERYLPGLLRSDLLHGLSRLERASQEDEGPAVRYLGSTIVLEDEACFCQFEGPTEAAVAEVNRKAGLRFDRIVPAVTVKAERRGSMEVSTPIPALKRSRMLVPIGVVVALAAAITWAVLTFAVNSGSEAAQEVTPGAVATSLSPAELRSIQNYHAFGASGSLTPAEVRSIGSYLFGASESLTPSQLTSIRNYHAFGASGPLTPAELRSIRFYLFGAPGGK